MEFDLCTLYIRKEESVKVRSTQAHMLFTTFKGTFSKEQQLPFDIPHSLGNHLWSGGSKRAQELYVECFNLHTTPWGPKFNVNMQ